MASVSFVFIIQSWRKRTFMRSHKLYMGFKSGKFSCDYLIVLEEFGHNLGCGTARDLGCVFVFVCVLFCFCGGGGGGYY